MVDFLEASPLRYALTVKPTVYVSHIRQFWSTARIETTEEGTKILATVDGIVRSVSESSLRRNLKLRDEDEISSLPDAGLFENLTLMGYNISPNQKFTFQKGQFFHQWKYLIHTIMQCLSPKSIWFNEFSRNIATALVCLATNRTCNFSKMIFDGLVKNINNKVSKILMYPRARIAQSFALPPVADEPASPVRDVSQGEACPTDSGFIADQDRATIAKSSTLPHDSAPRVTSPVADEGKNGLLLHDLEMMPQSRGGVWMKGRKLLRISDETKEMAMVLTSIDAATVLAGGIDDVPTGSGSIPTVGPPAADIPTSSDVVPTASPVFATATVSQQRKSWVKKQKRDYYMAVIRNNLGWKVKDFKGMTFEEVEAKFNSVYKQMEDFIPMGSKEDAKRYKRKGIRFDQESSKKLKSSEEVIEEAKSTDENPEEKIKEMMQLIPIEEVYVEALQVKHPIIDWKVHKEGREATRRSSGWEEAQPIINKEIFMLVEKDYPLRKGLALVMICYKLQVENFSQMENDLVLKIYKIANSPRQQEQLPTASEVGSHWVKKSEATARKIALLC
nr:synaptobrevin, longin-like domain protein [Tanacetum cinerariifolium]